MSTKLKIAIKNRWTGSIIFEYEKENNTLKDTVLEYIRQELDKGKYRADLTDANLTGADLTRANLTRANLTDADLTRANLTDANLTGADLTDANLTDADLTRANLTTIKNDMFIVLLHAIPEIKFLKQNIIDGKIDGSTYEGKCACLSGTLENGARANNGPNEKIIVGRILDCRNSSRPIERFFLNINQGDTPETNQCSKLALEWLEEFELLIAPLQKETVA